LGLSGAVLDDKAGGTVEHRNGKRVRIPLKLKVSIDGHNTLYTLTHDISINGLSMRLTHPDLQRHAFVTIELQDDMSNRYWQTRAMVVHHSSRGTGVLFAEALPPSFDIKAHDPKRFETAVEQKQYANPYQA
jgi:hypothetical protein